MRSTIAFLSPLVVALGVTAGAVAGPPGPCHQAVAAEVAEARLEPIPIELSDRAAQPRPDEVVGGWHAVFITLAVIVFLAIVVVVILEATHHHVFVHECEGCLHHAPPPPPPAYPPAGEPPPPEGPS